MENIGGGGTAHFGADDDGTEAWDEDAYHQRQESRSWLDAAALAPIAAQRGNTTNSNQQIISLNALARVHYRRSIGTRGGAQASAAD
ncbi:hypothetical protein T492DRAFT_870203 [Pavlovales sp. CCMP2436]|nr:hypothetical protein T492DRAFT_870203 [Pavlovales sp. CCMP2436]